MSGDIEHVPPVPSRRLAPSVIIQTAEQLDKRPAQLRKQIQGLDAEEHQPLTVPRRRSWLAIKSAVIGKSSTPGPPRPCVDTGPCRNLPQHTRTGTSPESVP